MRRDVDDVFELPRASALPAPPEVVLQALTPLLTNARRERIASVIAARTRSVVPVLDGLLDPHNIGAVLRSADAFGVQEVHVIETDDTFLAARRVAQGTERWIDVVRHPSAATCVAALRARGHRVYVAAMDGDLHPEQLREHPHVAVVFGNEHAGVSAEMRALADGTYTIPMCGFVQSLNVSVAAAITLFSAMRGRSGDLSESERLALSARCAMQSVPRAHEVVLEHLRRQRA